MKYQPAAKASANPRTKVMMTFRRTCQCDPNSQHSPNGNPVQPAGLVIRFQKSRQRT
jgi:hypothetical protein